MYKSKSNIETPKSKVGHREEDVVIGLILRMLAEDLFDVFDDELHGVIFRVHVGHFAFEAVVSHDGWCEDDCEIFGSHLVRS